MSFANEASLPPLPVPALAATTTQLLTALKPLLSHLEYELLLADCSDFLANPHIALIQRHLVAAQHHPNHLCYLNSINDEVNPGIYGELNNDILPRNPYLVLEEDPYLQTINPPNQAQRAALLINSSLKFVVSLRNETLAPDVTPKNKNPLTMNCYRNLFGTTRVPEEDHVTIRRLHLNHVVVVCNNQFWQLEVLRPCGESDSIWFSDHELAEHLEAIIASATTATPLETVNNSIGLLTTQTFDMWKTSRRELARSNGAVLELIDSALFVVVLDHLNAPRTDDAKTAVILHGSSNLLPGTSVQAGSCTLRWYDKLQLVVTANLVAGVVWELASMDLTAILRYISDIYTDSILKLARDINGAEYTLFDRLIKFVSAADAAKPTPQPLALNRTPELLQLIHLAETRLADLINQHEYHTLAVKLDTHVLAKYGVAVDSALQVCFQIAYYLLYGRVVNTLEPITTRKFRDARTELIPVQNEHLLRLVKLFLSNGDRALKWLRFQECCAIHAKQYLDAMQGRGFERHLLALTHCVRLPQAAHYLNRLNPELPPIPLAAPVPPLLANPAIDRLTLPELLISNCGNPALNLFGITPAIDQGFGIGYIIHADRVIITISSKHRQTQRFLDTFRTVVADLKLLLEGQSGFLLKTADTESRRKELQQLAAPDTNGDAGGAGAAITLLLPEGGELPYDAVSPTEPARPRADSTEFDVFGGYGYFDFGEVDHRLDVLSHTNSFQHSEISISMPRLSSASRHHSRHHSQTNLSKLSDDLREKMSLSERIRDRLQSSETVNERPPRDRRQIGRQLDMSGYK